MRGGMRCGEACRRSGTRSKSCGACASPEWSWAVCRKGSIATSSRRNWLHSSGSWRAPAGESRREQPPGFRGARRKGAARGERFRTPGETTELHAGAKRIKREMVKPIHELVPGYIRSIDPYEPGKPIEEVERELKI